MTSADQAALIWCPFSDAAAARAAAAALLDQRLIACANLFPQVESVFGWQGGRQISSECGALFKTSAHLLESAMTRLEELHPYEAPAITGWTAHPSENTLEWLRQETAF